MFVVINASAPLTWRAQSKHQGRARAEEGEVEGKAREGGI
jgi:hypothetical protein